MALKPPLAIFSELHGTCIKHMMGTPQQLSLGGWGLGFWASSVWRIFSTAFVLHGHCLVDYEVLGTEQSQPIGFILVLIQYLDSIKKCVYQVLKKSINLQASASWILFGRNKRKNTEVTSRCLIQFS